MFKVAKPDNTIENWTLFKTQRKYSRKLLLNTKEEFLKNQMEENRKNPRAFWRKLNKIVGNTKNSQIFTSIFDDQGKKTEKGDAAEFMNEYFTTTGENLNEHNCTTWTAHSFFPHLPTNNFLLNVVNEDKVRKYVNTLDITKPSGLENLNNRLLRDTFEVLMYELTAMFNESIIQEYFPKKWKMGIITPIPKTGNLLLKSNWRPITILTTLGKLLEKIVHFQTNTYLNLNEILSYDHHGFRQGYSTSSAIFEFLTNIYEAKVTDKITGCIYVDYQKAFDTINHNILFKKLELYGFSTPCIKWFKSYLSDRTQVTKCENTYLSTTRAITIGMPQGSTLGLLLFILYVNDLYHIKHIFNVSLKMYADDTVIYAHGNSILEVRTILQSCMDYVYKWCITNRLCMNMKKTKKMWFENNSQLTEGNSNYTIDINGVSLSRV